MKSIEQLAQVGYEVLQDVWATSNEATSLDVSTHWRDLLQTDKQAFIAATRHIIDQANQVH